PLSAHSLHDALPISLALVLMAASGLMLRSFAKLVTVDLGFDVANVLTLEVEPLDQTAVMRREYYASLADALRRLPEVVSAGAIDQLDLDGGGTYRYPMTDTGATIPGPQRTVLPGDLEAMRVRPLAGRLFDGADRMTGEAVIVSAAASQQYCGGKPLGQTLRTGDKIPRQWRIVGVVPNIRHAGPEWRVGPGVYVLPDPNETAAMFNRLAMVMRLRDGASPSIHRLKQIAETVGPRVLVERAGPVAFGLVAGLAGTYYATRFITSFLFRTTPHDPLTLAAVVAVLGAAAYLAAWLPARRAASVDPVTALRAE